VFVGFEAVWAKKAGNFDSKRYCVSEAPIVAAQPHRVQTSKVKATGDTAVQQSIAMNK
jgi:hypothetical protein